MYSRQCRVATDLEAPGRQWLALAEWLAAAVKRIEDERVGGALRTDGRLLHVARQDHRVVGQGQQARQDALDDLGKIAAW